LHKDSFNNDTGGFDSFRLPLIKPYYYLTLHDIQKLALMNNVIMVYTPFVEQNIEPSIGQKVFHWFVIVPASDVEEGFEQEEAFLDYIQRFNIKQPNWLNPKDAYSQFTKTGCQDWVPSCNYSG